MHARRTWKRDGSVHHLSVETAVAVLHAKGTDAVRRQSPEQIRASLEAGRTLETPHSTICLSRSPL